MSSSKSKNQFGLSRDIPDNVAREVRRRSGFGCVFCGLFISDYEHIEPEFRNAKEHDPARICLLCPNHHRKVTNRLVTKMQVFAAYAKPKALQNGFAHEEPDFISLTRPCRVAVGSISFEDPGEILRVDGRTILGLRDDEGRVTLDGIFFDRNAKEILRIEGNIWRGATTNWDVEFEGRTLTLRHGPADISLVVDLTESRALHFRHIHLRTPGLVIETLTNGRLRVSQPGGPWMDNVEAVTKGPIVVTNGRFVVEGGSVFSAGTTFGTMAPPGAPTVAVTGSKRQLGRNSTCACGSGRKAKRCCMR